MSYMKDSTGLLRKKQSADMPSPPSRLTVRRQANCFTYAATDIVGSMHESHASVATGASGACQGSASRAHRRAFVF